MKHTGKVMGAALLLGTIGMLCGGIVQLHADAEASPDWIKITATSKYVYTVDASGAQSPFVFNTGNNAHQKSVVVDLGRNGDGTDEIDQCYVLSKIQVASTANISNPIKVEVSVDDNKYIEVLNSTGLTGGWKSENFSSEVNARYVKITATDAWATFWGDNPFSFYGYAGELAPNTDPEGLTLVGVETDMVYPMVKGDTFQLNAQMKNLTGEGEISYALAEETGGVTLSETGLLTIGAAGDGTTEYTVTASVPNPGDADAPYTASMKFVILEEELAMYSTYYKISETYDLLDYVSLDMARVFGKGDMEYSIDGTTYVPFTTNEKLSSPVTARYIKTDNDFALYGVSDALPVAGVASEDINGFFPSNPLENIKDGDLLTSAQTPNGNLLGEGDVLGSITIELDGYYRINAVRVFSMWNSVASGFISYSLDGETFTGKTDLNFRYVACQLGDDRSEYMDIAVPAGTVAAKYVRLNITGKSTSQTFAAVREFNAYGEKMPDVAIAYNANATDEVTGMPLGGKIAFGALLETPASPVRKDYVFKGWYKDGDCEEEFDFSAPLFEDTTLYAKWNALYTVTFETNGGSAVAAETVENGNALAEPQVPIKDGFAFKGWYANEELTKAYDFTATVTKSTTLYAKWNALYTVTFETNGGSAVAAETVENGNTLTEPQVPIKDGFAFNGWYADEELTKAYDFTATVTGNMTLYAKWNAAFTVTFETNGGSAVAPQPVENGNTATQPAAPTKEGHTFGGWFADESLTTAFDFSLPITANTTVYAKWNVVKYTVTFVANGGSAVAEATVESGNAVVKPEDPVKDGFVFKGWFADSELTTVYDFAAAVTQNATVYAKWNALFTVAFDTDGGSEIVAVKVENGSTLARPENPVKDGFAFKGWFTDEDCTEKFDFTVGITSNITLYAKWETALPAYAFTVNKTGSGAVLGVPYGDVDEGTVITLTFVPEDGYEIESVKVNGTEAEIKGLALNITVSGAVTVEVVFSAIGDQIESQDDGLSAGAIAAIAVCSGCVVVAAGIATFFIIKKRKGNS